MSILEIKCPKCNSDKILKRTVVPRYETYTRKFINGRLCDVRIQDPKFYVCYKCWHKFNIK